jgi:hypothetical protein
MTTPACYQAALSSHLQLLPDEKAALQLLQEQPDSVDAVVVFPQALAAAKAARAAAAGTTGTAAEGKHRDASVVGPASLRSSMWVGGTNAAAGVNSSSSSGGSKAAGGSQTLGCGSPGNADGDGLLLDYVIRMNSSDVPPTQLLQDLFDVSPGIMPLPGNLLW